MSSYTTASPIPPVAPTIKATRNQERQLRHELIAMNPKLHYMVEGASTVETIPGLSPELLRPFCLNLDLFLNLDNIFIIPAQFYQPFRWPYLEQLQDGEPFHTIFEWIRLAYAAHEDTVEIGLTPRLDELCAIYTATRLLNMCPEGIQVEKIIAGKLSHRNLTMLEGREVWYTFRDLPRCGAMTAFIRNLQDDTVPRMKAEVAANQIPAVTLQHLWVWMRDEPDLMTLFAKNPMERFVGMTQNPDPDWKEKRLKEWVEEVKELLREGKLEVPKEEDIGNV
ncbi:hypothetical protein BCR34DRAFT_177584 [Clohesyomyces aquaticus]|uniref:Uncharacterized protein n=1 Tax=Clohesyomyces aquaticus TaxID=1231657 RepID=A0A1Y1ZYP7_9PLEO|nr:hypothetical protein BCR34DRAFT_177584 [Clohesyomyces aquaticus]